MESNVGWVVLNTLYDLLWRIVSIAFWKTAGVEETPNGRRDYKKTLNPYLETEQYALPRPEDLMIWLTGGCKFTKLELSAVYQQMLLDEESYPYVTINTQRGLYIYLSPFTLWDSLTHSL